MRGFAVSRIWTRLFPWIGVGAVLMVISGLLLFWSDPVRFYGNVFFRIKFVGLVLALLNALAFHFGIERRLPEWDTALVPPRAARFAGGVSLLLWTLIIVAALVGRRHYGSRHRVLLKGRLPAFAEATAGPP